MTNFDSHGVYYSAFNLLQDARHYDDLGKRPEIRLYRAESGRIEGVELLTPQAGAEDGDVALPPRCTKCGLYQEHVSESSICWTYDTPDGYPEPNGAHNWQPEQETGNIGGMQIGF